MRYIKIYGSAPLGKSEITEDDLVDVRTGNIDFLIDAAKMSWFDGSENIWREINSK